MKISSPNRLLFGAGVLSTLLGTAASFGWYEHVQPLLQIVPSDVAMDGNVALGFLFCGLACLFVGYRWNVAARIAAGAAVILGGLVVAGPVLKIGFSLERLFPHLSAVGARHVSQISQLLNHASINPATQSVPHIGAICLLLCGLALLIFAGNRPGYRQPFSSAAMGAAVLALSIASLVEYLLIVTTITDRSRLFEMPLHAAAGFLILGAGILHASWRVWSRRVYGPRIEGSFLPPLLLRPWAPVLMTCLAASLSLLIWRALVIRQNADIRCAVGLEATKTGDTLGAQITARATALERFGRQWDIYGTPTEAQWNRECALLVRDLPGWHELTMVDTSGRVVWTYPASDSHKLFGYDVYADPKRRAAYLDAQKTGKVFVTPQFSLLMGGRGFVMVAPITQHGKPRGYVSGVFRSATAFDAMMKSNVTPGFIVSIDEGSPVKTLWSRALPLSLDNPVKTPIRPGDASRFDAWEQVLPITAYDLQWRLRVRPDRTFFDQEQASLPTVALVLGLLLAGMVGATLHFAQAARMHSEHIGAVNVNLAREVSDREISQRQLEAEGERTRQGWAEARRQSALLANQALELKRSNESLTEFASIASHDLKEPLRKIQTFSDMLRRRAGDKLDGDALGYLDRMAGSAQRMQTLIDGLLTYSRASAQPSELVAVDLNEILREVMDDLEVRLVESDARVVRGPLPTIEADPVQMRQLFQNLLGNALKFRRPDVPTQVRLTGAVEDGVARVTISDNGIGFEPRFSERIFRIFERLESSQRFEGTGIGLAICRTIVDHHHGTIRASAAPDEGATFTIELPIVVCALGESVGDAAATATRA